MSNQLQRTNFACCDALPTPQSQLESLQRLLAEKQTEVDALRTERDNQYEYNAGLIERYAALEAQRDALASALQKMLKLPRMHQSHVVTVTEESDAYNSAHVALSQPNIASALAAVKAKDAVIEAAHVFSAWLQECGLGFVDIAQFSRLANKQHAALAAYGEARSGK